MGLLYLHAVYNIASFPSYSQLLQWGARRLMIGYNDDRKHKKGYQVILQTAVGSLLNFFYLPLSFLLSNWIVQNYVIIPQHKLSVQAFYYRSRLYSSYASNHRKGFIQCLLDIFYCLNYVLPHSRHIQLKHPLPLINAKDSIST